MGNAAFWLYPLGCYGVVGISLGYLSYNRGLPLTIRSALQPLFGRAMSGSAGHVVDIVAILATIVGLSVTIVMAYHSLPQAYSILVVQTGWWVTMVNRL